MPDAKLIKNLEKHGFLLDFPDYNTPEELILEILKENNPRINTSLPLFLKDGINYENITSKLSIYEKKEFNKIILISENIYKKERIENKLLDIIKQKRIKSKFSQQEFNEFYDLFKESNLRVNRNEEKIIEKQSKLRLNLDLNKSLSILFSPAKIKIMKKIFNHEKLTNTELKYYYRSISNINKAVLNIGLQNYSRVIEMTKKIREH
ncbi:MAG: hypothetical protein Q7S33_02985 [Nanoarchaeota archaeon]|nr:hypothetical protein [Nanoarchaeota archaeon]